MDRSYMPVTDPEYKRDWMREYRKRHKTPQRPSGPRPISIYAQETRHLALDAIAWMSRKRRDLMDVYQYASRLPVEWWAKKDGYSIDEIIRTLKLEIECAPK